MSESLSSADPLKGSGICGIAECGDKAVLVVHAIEGLSSDSDGLAEESYGLGVLRIDDRIRGPEHTDTLIHEFLHVRLPHWQEAEVLRLGRQLASLLHLPEVKRRSFS